MMSERQPVRRASGKHRMALAARRRFKPLTADTRHVDTSDLERYAKASAEVGAEVRPGVGAGTQTVMDMQRRKFAGQARRTQASQRVQQDNRIAATGKADAQARSMTQSRFKKRRESLLDLLRRGRCGRLSAAPAL